MIRRRRLFEDENERERLNFAHNVLNKSGKLTKVPNILLQLFIKDRDTAWKKEFGLSSDAWYEILTNKWAEQRRAGRGYIYSLTKQGKYVVKEICEELGIPFSKEAVADRFGFDYRKGQDVESFDRSYELTDETTEIQGVTVYRIRALVPMTFDEHERHIEVKPGDVGGWVESEENLEQNSLSWVGDDSVVLGDACVYDHSFIVDSAVVSGNARVHNNSLVCDDAEVTEYADIRYSCVCDYASVSGRAKVIDGSTIEQNAEVGGDCTVKGSKIYEDAMVTGGYCNESEVFGNAKMTDSTHIYSTKLFDNAEISDHAKAANSEIFGNASVYGNAEVNVAKVYDDAEVFDNAIIDSPHYGSALVTTIILGKAKIHGDVNTTDVYPTPVNRYYDVHIGGNADVTTNDDFEAEMR